MTQTLVEQVLAPFAQDVRELRSEVHEDNRQRRRDNKRTFVAILVAAGLLLGLIAIGLQNRNINAQNAELIRRNEQVSQQIADCTTAGGKCYEESRKRTGQVVGDIARMNIFIHKCMWENRDYTDAQIEQCVATKIAAAADRTPPPAQPQK